MKLGAALTLRAYQAQRLGELRNRATQNVTVQEGDAPNEDPGGLVDAFEALSAEHGLLVVRINRTNLQTPFGDATLSDALQDREHKRRVKNVLEAAAEAAQQGVGQNRWMRSEIKTVPVIAVADFRRQIDDLIEDIRKLDADIQAVNWQTDLVE